MEMKTVKELENGEEIVVKGIARTNISFNKDGEQKTANVFVLHCGDFYLKVNENTTMYKQIEKFINDEKILIPTKELDEKFTIDVVKSQKQKGFSYQSIRELSKGIDSDTADELFNF